MTAARAALLRVVERLPSAANGDQLCEAFAAQEAPAREYAATGEWEGRAALANTLMGLGGVFLHGWRTLGGKGDKLDRPKAAALFEEARTLYAGCTVDAESGELARWARRMASIAYAEVEYAAGPPAARRGVLLVFPTGCPSNPCAPPSLVASRSPSEIGAAGKAAR